MDDLHPEPSLEPLRLHPLSKPGAVRALAAGASRRGAGLDLWFALRGELASLVLPDADQIERQDELWRSTCFEAFVRAPGAERYLEFNFAPSLHWNAYAFSGYRQGMRAAEMSAPFIDHFEEEDGAWMIMVELNELPGISPGDALRVGLSAVIEETNGAKSYWALAHPPGKPDFHHERCFALELP